MTPTPKEKAKQLVEKYESIFISANADEWTAPSKQCALVHVNELLDMLWMFSDSINGQSAYNEYQQVKEEIEKL